MAATVILMALMLSLKHLKNPTAYCAAVWILHPHAAHNYEAIHILCKSNSRPKLTYNHIKAYPYFAL